MNPNPIELNLITIDRNESVKVMSETGACSGTTAIGQGETSFAWEPDRRVFTMRANSTWESDVAVAMDFSFKERVAESVMFPSYLGVFDQWSVDEAQKYTFVGPGSGESAGEALHRLGLPYLLIRVASGGVFLFGVDPDFHVTLDTRIDSEGCLHITAGWAYRAAAGRHAEECRRFLLEWADSESDAVKRWHDWASLTDQNTLAWTSDVAFQNYDFLSKNGDGWFRDIECANGFIKESLRHHGMFTMHGWYDEIGRYCFDRESGKLVDAWTAFRHMSSPEFQKFDKTVSESATGLGAAPYRWRNLRNYSPVSMDWGKIRDRLSFAKKSGYRTCLYILTGLQRAGEWREYEGTGLALEFDVPLWQGPDLMGPSHLQNPLHPDVCQAVLSYVGALLGKVGDLCDAFVIDESYYIAAGTLGPSSMPGYADRAQAMLFREITRLCHDYKPGFAVFSADQTALPLAIVSDRSYPYCLHCDGIYQDSASWPDVFSACQMAAGQKPAFICDWAPRTNFLLQQRAVVKHNATLAWSNGPFGDDTGLADLTPADLAKVADLWNFRIARRMSPSMDTRSFSAH